MKTRDEVARFVEKQMHWRYTSPTVPRKIHHHYGWVELKELMDFLYGGPPSNPNDELNTNINSVDLPFSE